MDTVGHFTLRFLPLDHAVAITVIEAKPWESDGQLLDEKNRSVISFPTLTHQLIGINTPQVKADEGGYTVDV
jgi:hypothetical protein